jgi:hypothetical protein
MPANLKIVLLKFLHREAINKVEFLKSRPDIFYLNYLDKLNPMRFDASEHIFEKGHKCKDVFLILAGDIINEESHRHFGAGKLIG